MSQNAPEGPSEKSLHGSVFRPRSHEEMLKVIELAFDYRGDVTLELKSRESISGYVLNRVFDDSRSYVEIFQSNHPDPRKIFCREIQAVRFTGEDTASGKSWEAWVRKNQEGRKR